MYADLWAWCPRRQVVCVGMCAPTNKCFAAAASDVVALRASALRIPRRGWVGAASAGKRGHPTPPQQNKQQDLQQICRRRAGRADKHSWPCPCYTSFAGAGADTFMAAEEKSTLVVTGSTASPGAGAGAPLPGPPGSSTGEPCAAVKASKRQAAPTSKVSHEPTAGCILGGRWLCQGCRPRTGR